MIQTYIYYFDSSFCKLWCWIKKFHGTSSYLFDNTSQDMDGYLNVLLNCLYHILLYQWFYLNKSYFFHIWLIVYPVILAIIYALKITLYSIRIKFIRYYLLLKKNDSKKYLKINVTVIVYIFQFLKKSQRDNNKKPHIYTTTYTGINHNYDN